MEYCKEFANLFFGNIMNLLVPTNALKQGLCARSSARYKIIIQSWLPHPRTKCNSATIMSRTKSSSTSTRTKGRPSRTLSNTICGCGCRAGTMGANST